MSQQLLSATQPDGLHSDQTRSCSPHRRQHAKRRLQAWVVHPAVLAGAGTVALFVGIACIALAFSLPAHHSATALSAAEAHSPDPGLPDYALPPSVLAAIDGEEGTLYECKQSAELAAPQQYEAAAHAAELGTFGALASSLGGPSAVQATLDGLPNLRVPLVFWVLHSSTYVYSQRFPAAIATQVAVLNAAFKKGALQFSLVAWLPLEVTDAEVEGCGAAHHGSLVGRLASGPASLVHVVVCKPGDVHGQTPLLVGSSAEVAAGEGPQGPEPGAGLPPNTILLRRSALWLSRASLVHQMGHFLGLPHPFPASASCGGEGDFVADTPRQYAPHLGCDLDGGMHVCEGEDGPLPVYNFMDFTNDTCRQQFNPGQLARMRAMLAEYRPALHRTAVRGYHATPLPLMRAFQSGLPPATVIQAQQEAASVLAAGREAGLQGRTCPEAAVAPGSGDGGDDTGGEPADGCDALDAAALSRRLNEFWNTSHQAALAMGERQGRGAASQQLSLAPHRCSCLGADDRGQMLWVGELPGAGYRVDAFRIVRRGTPGGGGDVLQPPSPCDDGEDGGVTSSGGGCAAADGGGLLQRDADAAGGDAMLPPLRVVLRVGYSANGLQNPRCTPSPVTLTQPLQLVECTAPLPGRFVSLEVVGVPPPEAAPCLCGVHPLSYLANPSQVVGAPAAGTPGRVLPPGRWWRTAQSTTASSADRGLANMGERQGGTAPLPWAAAAARRGRVGGEMEEDDDGALGCSSTLPELEPWWALVTGLDPVAVRGVRLHLPHACPHIAPGGPADGLEAEGGGGSWQLPAGCPPPPPATLDVLVGDSVEELVGQRGHRGAACVAGVSVLPGQLVDLDCGRTVQGTAVVVVARFPRPASLSLCGLQLLGARELDLGRALLEERQHAMVHPPSLGPWRSLPVDGREGSCLRLPQGHVGGGAWGLNLQGSYRVTGVVVAATGSNVTVSLEDGAGREVWRGWVGGGPPGGGVSLEVPPSAPASFLAVRGWSSLCQLRLFATTPTSLAPYLLPRPPSSLGKSTNTPSSQQDPPPGPGDPPSPETPPPVEGSAEGGGGVGSLLAQQGPAASDGRGGGSTLEALFDGDYRTCVHVERSFQGRGDPPWVVVPLSGSFRVDSVALIGGSQRQGNLTLSLLPPGRAALLLRELGWGPQPSFPGATTPASAADAQKQALGGDSPPGEGPGPVGVDGVNSRVDPGADGGAGLTLEAALKLAGGVRCGESVSVPGWEEASMVCEGVRGGGEAKGDRGQGLVAEALFIAGEPGRAEMSLCEVEARGEAAAA